MEKTIKARIQHKHDTEANWLKATIFIPLASEIIVYDPDENYDYPRIKIGDGKTNINTLPFITKDYAKTSDVPTKPADIGADPAGTAAAAVSAHNTSTDSHGDLRLELKAINDRLTAFFDSDNQTLDELSEIVAYITSNKALIDSITTSKVSVADIINNLTTNVANKPLSAAQGVTLKALIDAITVPTKVSQLANDSGFITGYTETDPTVPAWAKAANKPTYTASEVGADVSGTASNLVSAHNTATDSHSDIREAIEKVLPEVSEANNGEFLRVSNGVWTSCAISSAEEVAF